MVSVRRFVLSSLVIISFFISPDHAADAQVDHSQLHQSKIHGLVVMLAPDGLYHGKTIDIIATPGDSKKVKLVGTTGREMQISLEEAVRVVKLRHPGADKQGIEISFDEKYSTKDGGSAGTAFALVLLSAYGDFTPNPQAAITGDITVDGTVQSVGDVAAKVHGAALDHMELAAIPAADEAQMEDAILIDGPTSLWEIPIFSMKTLDDGIALTRQDADAKLAQAIKQFADLKSAYAGKPVEALKDGDGAAKLAELLSLAPNFVSVKYLQQLAAGKKPEHLSVIATVQQAFAALGPTRKGLTAAVGRGGQPVSDADKATVQKNLDHIKAIGDPSAASLFDPLNEFVNTYVKFSNIPGGAAGVRDRMSMRDEVRSRQAAIRTALEAIVSDRATLDKLLH
jgi:hypothetical protein